MGVKGKVKGMIKDWAWIPFSVNSLAITSPRDSQFRGIESKSLGSGVIISPEGYILTNNHVVDHATDVTVTLADKREMKARVVGTHPRTDIAVLKIEGSNFPSLLLGDSSKVEVGDIVLAIGNPFGVGQTVTRASSARRAAADWASKRWKTSSRRMHRSIRVTRAARWWTMKDT